MLRDPTEALVFLARRESHRAGYHPRLMLVAALYSAGSSRVTIGLGDDMSAPSDGVTLYLPAGTKPVRAIEREIQKAVDSGVVKQDIRQRGNAVRLFWKKAT